MNHDLVGRGRQAAEEILQQLRLMSEAVPTASPPLPSEPEPLPPLRLTVSATPEGVRIEFNRPLADPYFNIPDSRMARQVAEMIRQASYTKGCGEAVQQRPKHAKKERK